MTLVYDSEFGGINSGKKHFKIICQECKQSYEIDLRYTPEVCGACGSDKIEIWQKVQ
jgi:rRNA maturation endonuclease Nob1